MHMFKELEKGRSGLAGSSKSKKSSESSPLVSKNYILLPKLAV
jgi:hypothetical protein